MPETVGGRVQAGESLLDALSREAMEEAGVVPAGPMCPFAGFWWSQTGRRPGQGPAHVQKAGPMPPGDETSGTVSTDPLTAMHMIRQFQAGRRRGVRCRVLLWYRQLPQWMFDPNVHGHGALFSSDARGGNRVIREDESCSDPGCAINID